MGVNRLRERLGNSILDVWIVSAGYGLISEARIIAPYEATFNSMGRKRAIAWAQTLRIHDSFEHLVEGYDLVFLLLGDKYLRALQLPVNMREDQSAVLLLANSSVASLPPMRSRTALVGLGPADAKRFRYGLVGLKGRLMRTVLEQAAADPHLLAKIHVEPELVSRLLDGHRASNVSQPLFPEAMPERHRSGTRVHLVAEERDTTEADTPLHPVPDTPAAPNMQFEMQYFIPDVDDRVDPHFDFLHDTHTADRNPHKDDWYAHEFFDPPNYDGVLISRVAVEASKLKRARILAVGGVHDYVRFRGPIMGDCGAFSYVTEDVPPFETSEILNYYHDFGFDYGVSVDHLIVGPFAERGIRERRFDITLRNAEEFLRLYNGEPKYRFHPIGVIQGWDPDSYGRMAQLVLEMGYSYVAIGGLARASTRAILDVLAAVRPFLRADTRLHLFGVARLTAAHVFRHLGVTSFDSASPLRRAWLGVEANYHTLSGKMYAAIRIPPVTAHGSRAKRLVERGTATLATLRRLENNALQALRGYDRGEVSLDLALDKILEYDELLDSPKDGVSTGPVKDRRREKHPHLYREVLEDRPW
ncbi:tRNA-guanine transglycosylase DpdA, partial [Limnoraphis robusta CCNP1324]|uniref:tRNA-guanine transglycosylase DpdA n=1 Tax=Limnoraphis robusta TaxID=1118279 RepID=UPI002B2105E7